MSKLAVSADRSDALPFAVVVGPALELPPPPQAASRQDAPIRAAKRRDLTGPYNQARAPRPRRGEIGVRARLPGPAAGYFEICGLKEQPRCLQEYL